MMRDLLLKVLYPSPDRIVHSIVEHAYTPFLNESIDVTKISKGVVVSYGIPDSFPVWFRREYAFLPQFVYAVKNAKVDCDGGCQVGDCVLQESYGSYPAVLSSVARRRAKEIIFFWRNKKTYYREPVVFIRPVGYYHFLTESLPCLLHALRYRPEVSVLLLSNGLKALPFVLEFLSILKDRESIKELRIVEGALFDCKEYVFASLEAHNGFVRPSDIMLLRKTFIQHNETKLNERKIFISRRKSKRSFSNQDEVERFLESAGMEIVCLEQLSIAGQIELFASASLIIANHGAGLANLIFGQKEARVIELFSPKWLNDCYCRLARTMQMEYAYLIAEDQGEWGIISIERLREKLDVKTVKK